MYTYTLRKKCSWNNNSFIDLKKKITLILKHTYNVRINGVISRPPLERAQVVNNEAELSPPKVLNLRCIKLAQIDMDLKYYNDVPVIH